VAWTAVFAARKGAGKLRILWIARSLPASDHPQRGRKGAAESSNKIAVETRVFFGRGAHGLAVLEVGEKVEERPWA